MVLFLLGGFKSGSGVPESCLVLLLGGLTSGESCLSLILLDPTLSSPSCGLFLLGGLKSLGEAFLFCLGGLKSGELSLSFLLRGLRSGESCRLFRLLGDVSLLPGGEGVKSFSTLTMDKLTGSTVCTAFHLKLNSGLSSVISITIGASSERK